MLENLSAWLNTAPLITPDEHAILIGAVTTVDPLLKTVSHFDKKLAPAARIAFDYCAGLAESIPGPIGIDTRAYASDPLVHAFFATRDDIYAMLGKSREVRNFLGTGVEQTTGDIYFMLGMRRHEKKVLGMARQGDVIHRDVPQSIIYFGDHTLREFGTDIKETRHRVRSAGFNSLALSFAAKLDAIRNQRQQLRQERDMLSGRTTGQDSATLEKRREELDAQLRVAAESLMPERILDAFSAWLSHPDLQLRLEPVTVTVDRMGVIAEPGTNDGQVNTLNFLELVFPELVGRDRRRWISIVARIQREEVLAAIAQHQQANRYIII